MSLWSSNVMFLFLEVTDIPRARSFMEDVLGLELIENRFHPPHERHGVAKYDAGNTILALNLAGRTFARHAEDGIVTVLGTDPRQEARIYAHLYTAGLNPPRSAGGVFPDHENHTYAVRSVMRPPADDEEPRPPHLEELRFAVEDLGESIAFYQEVLGLPLLHVDRERAVLAAANLRFVLHREATGRPVRQDGLLTVFYTPDIEEVYAALAARGLDFRNLTVKYSEIGGTVRFLTPTGHAFCLYEPSEESLSWESGPKVRQLMNRLGSEQTVH
jgi:catechol 2,3-dioxygenase-like lactoylglutathione lyase family enzyme